MRHIRDELGLHALGADTVVQGALKARVDVVDGRGEPRLFAVEARGIKELFAAVGLAVQQADCGRNLIALALFLIEMLIEPEIEDGQQKN